MNTIPRPYKVVPAYWNNAPTTFLVTRGGWKEKPWADMKSRKAAERVAERLNAGNVRQEVSR